MQKDKNILSGTHRVPLLELPKMPLPFYPRSGGHFQVYAGYREDVPAQVKYFVQLFWFIRGEADFLLDGAFRRLKAGDVCFHLPGEPHCHRIVSPYAEYRWIAFDGQKAAKFLLDYGYSSIGWHAGECPENLFREYNERLREMTPYSFRRMCAIIAEILACAGRGGPEEQKNQTLFRRAVNLCMEKFCDREFNVNTLADLLGVDRTTLGRHFQRSMGRSPWNYLESLRIQRAVSLLQSGHASLREIAELSGFRDANYLCRVIRKNCGVPPGKMRN